MPFKYNPFTGTLDVINPTIDSPFLFKGDINTASDFPTSSEVQNGWTYFIKTDVTDNDASKTNTGQSFSSGSEIAWNGTNWTELGNDLSKYALKSNVLELDNTDAFTPDSDYEPATKKYVDDSTETYTNTTPIPDDIGGYEAGDTFTDKTNSQMWTGLLYPYQYPSFTSFSFIGRVSVLEVGDVIPANRTWVWNTNDPDGHISANTVDIRDITNSVDIVVNTANTGSYVSTSAEIKKTAPGTHSYRIYADNDKGQTFNRTVSVYWRWRVFYGESSNTSLTESQIESLRASSLRTSANTTYDFVAGGYKYICYPSSFSTLTTFKDESTQLPVPFNQLSNVSVTNAYGETIEYKVHKSSNILGGAISIIAS